MTSKPVGGVNQDTPPTESRESYIQDAKGNPAGEL